MNEPADAAAPAAPAALADSNPSARSRPPLEIVVDGTDGAGKTSFITYLLAHCQQRGLRAASHAPYREREVYPLWADEPERAAHIITDLLAHHRAQSQLPGAPLDVLLWDRGWPTAYITTESPRARAAFLPLLPTITVLLLGTPEMTRAKARTYGARGEWVVDEALIRRYHAAYHSLAPPTAHKLLRTFPDPTSSRFDFAALAHQLSPELDAATHLGHKI